MSQILFNRLQARDDEKYSDYSQRSLLGLKRENDPGQPSGGRAKTAGSGVQPGLRRHGGSGLSYADWLKAKDAEKRLRRKLIGQAQNDIKEELLNVAKAERDKYEKRCKAMDNWLMQKKIEEAHKVANLRELERREEIEKQLRDEKKTNSYKEWMRLQSMKQRQTRKYNKRKQQTKDSVLARQMAEHEAMQQQRLQQIRDADGMYEHHDEMDMAGDEDDEDEMDDGIDAYEAMEEMDGMP